MSFSHPHDAPRLREDSWVGKNYGSGGSSWSTEWEAVPDNENVQDTQRVGYMSMNRIEIKRMIVNILQRIRDNADLILDDKGITWTGYTKKSARISLDYFRYELSYNTPYAHFVEFGLPPLYAQNIDMSALQDWVEGKLGVPREDAPYVTGKVAKKLQEEGYRGYRFLRKAIKLTVGQVGIKRLDRKESGPNWRDWEPPPSEWEQRADRVAAGLKRIQKILSRVERSGRRMRAFMKNPAAAAVDEGASLYKKRGRYFKKKKRRERQKKQKLPALQDLTSPWHFKYEGRRRKKWRTDSRMKTGRDQWKSWGYKFKEQSGSDPVWQKVYGKNMDNLFSPTMKPHIRRHKGTIAQITKRFGKEFVDYRHPATFMGGRPRNRKKQPSGRKMPGGSSPLAGIRVGGRMRAGSATPGGLSRAPPRTYGSSSARPIRSPLSLLYTRKRIKKRGTGAKDERRAARRFRTMFGGRRATKGWKMTKAERSRMRQWIKEMAAAEKRRVIGLKVAKAMEKRTDKTIIKKPKSVSTMKARPHKKSYIKRHRRKKNK